MTYEERMLPGSEIKVEFPIYNADHEAIDSAISDTEARVEEERERCSLEQNCTLSVFCQLLLSDSAPHRVYSYSAVCTHDECPNFRNSVHAEQTENS